MLFFSFLITGIIILRYVSATSSHEPISIYNEPNASKTLRTKSTSSQVDDYFSKFPDYATYLNALELGAKNYFEYHLIQKLSAPDYDTAKAQFLDSAKTNLATYSKNHYQWQFSALANLLDIPEDNVADILTELLNINAISGKLDTTNKQFISTHITDQENKKTIEYIRNVRGGVPISLIQIAEVTGLEKSRLTSIMQSLTSGPNSIGDYLSLEGVFIKDAQDSGLKKPREVTCYHCGAILDPGAKVCSSCNQTVITCEICKQGISFGETLGGCLYCGTDSYHYQHFAESVKVSGKCPNCHETLTEADIILKEASKGKK